MEATIFDTSPNEALGFWPLIAAWVSLKNRAYAETGFCGSLGSFFFFSFFTPAAPVTAASVAGLPPPLLKVDGPPDEVGKVLEDNCGREEDRSMDGSTRTLLCKRLTTMFRLWN